MHGLQFYRVIALILVNIVLSWDIAINNCFEYDMS